jgi:hypothetical protein
MTKGEVLSSSLVGHLKRGAAMNKARTQRSNTRRQILEFRQVQEGTLFEDHVKDRLDGLTNLVEDSVNSTFNLLLGEKTCVREDLEELIVKEEALRWIVRIASRSSGPIREKLWTEIDQALGGLENTAESLMHAGVEWPISDWVGLRNDAICLN